jgi:hypothetical protein
MSIWAVYQILLHQPLQPFASSSHDMLFTTSFFPFSKRRPALARVVETLDEGNSNDEKCFMEKSEAATNHLYCQASCIYELNGCFCFVPQNGIVYSAFPGIWFHTHHQQQDTTVFWNTIPKPSRDFLCNNKCKAALGPSFWEPSSLQHPFDVDEVFSICVDEFSPDTFNLCHRQHFSKCFKNIMLLTQESSCGIYRKLGVTNLGQDINMIVIFDVSMFRLATTVWIIPT